MKFIFSTFLKDLRIATSYKAQFIFSIISIFFAIFTFYLISKLVDTGSSVHLEKYDNYMFFLIFGLISAETSMIIITNPLKNIRDMQLTGVFEELIASGRNVKEVILSTFAYPIIWLIFRISLYLLVSIFIFDIGIQFYNLSYISLLSIFLFCIGMIGIGLISISSVITIKSGNFIGTLYLSLSSFFGTVAYPISVLPEQIIFISYLIPTTHFLAIFREDAISQNLLIMDIAYNFIFLLTLSVSLFLMGLYLLDVSIKVAKKHGSLLYY